MEPSHHRKYPRADFLDYCEGDFFVTVCTAEKKHYFGIIRDNQMYLSVIGRFLAENIHQISSHHRDSSILNSVIMPNHLHLIVRIVGSRPVATAPGIATGNLTTASNLGRLNQLARLSVATGRDPTLTTHHNSRLAIVIGGMKAAVTRYARKNNFEFNWQKRFHEHLIRGPRDGDYIWNYIDNNVINWNKDCFY